MLLFVHYNKLNHFFLLLCVCDNSDKGYFSLVSK